MLRRGSCVLGILALIFSLEARSLYKHRTKRWSHYGGAEDNDIREALNALEMRTKSSIDKEDVYTNDVEELPSSLPSRYELLKALDTGFDPMQDHSEDDDTYSLPSREKDQYESYAPYATPVDLSELRNILEPDEEGKEDDEPTSDVDAETMAEILEAGEGGTEETSPAVTPEPVGTAELEDIFSEDNTQKMTDEQSAKLPTASKYDADDDASKMINKEWLSTDQFVPMKDRADKKKRQAQDTTGSQLEKYAAENDILQKENEYLAGALNAATLGQMEHTDKYIKEQYNFLKKAVTMEEALQKFADADDDNGQAVAKRVLAKKESGLYASDEGYGINPFLRQILQQYGPRADNEMKKRQPTVLADDDDTENSSDEDDENDNNGSDEGEKEMDVPDNLEQMVSDLTLAQRKKLEQEITTLLDSEELSSKCPAVERVADDCEELMRRYSIDLDAEAKDVCNRHKLCYSCGSSLVEDRGLNKEGCDRMFMAAAQALCGYDNQCRDSAAGLFVLMKKQHHYIARPAPSTAELCSRRCVLDYLLDGE